MTPVLALTPQQQLHFEYGLCVVLLLGIPSLVWIALKKVRMPSADLWGPIYDRVEAEYQRERSLAPHDSDPDIDFEFHTYRGFLSFFEQSRHAHRMPARKALLLAKAMHRRNLCFCLLPYPGLVFVPVLSWFNLWKVRRTVRQATAAARR